MSRAGSLPAGLWGFPLTPFTAEGAVDRPALQRAVRHQVDGGVDVVVACGTIAEAASLSPAERALVARDVVREAARQGSPPVLVTIGPDAPAALTAAVDARDAGADGVVVLAPPGIGVADLRAHLEAIARACGLPMVLYQRGDLILEPEGLAQLLEVGLLAGLKDGQGDLRRFRRLRAAAEGRLVLVAAWEDMTLPYWAAGVDAFAPASAAHDPWYARAWLDRLTAGDVAGARRLLDAFAHPFSDLRRSRPEIDVAAVKAILARRGLGSGSVRAPWRELSAAEREQVATLVDALDRLRVSC